LQRPMGENDDKLCDSKWEEIRNGANTTDKKRPAWAQSGEVCRPEESQGRQGVKAVGKKQRVARYKKQEIKLN